MRFLNIMVGLLVVGALLWGGYWWINAGMRRAAVETWFEERRADGWAAEYADLRVTGFPNRVDTILTGLDLADPASGWAWSADRFELLSLSYRPDAAHAVWLGEQRIGTPGGAMSVEGERLRASLVVSPDGRFRLNRAQLEGRDLAIVLPDGERVFVPVLDAATAVQDAGGAVHRLGLNLEDVALSDGLQARFDAADLLPEAITVIHLDATATFDAPVSLRSLEAGAPEIDALRIDDLSGAWGELDLRAQGDLTAGIGGLAQGRLTVRARNWERMLDLAVANGVVDDGTAAAARFGLQLLANAGGDRNVLQAPLVFADGVTRLGPLAIGPAPALHRQ